MNLMIPQRKSTAVAVQPVNVETLPAVYLDTQPSNKNTLGAKVDAINGLLAGAYARASMLELTPDESKRLLADFDDADFYKGAGGDQTLLYLDYVAIRKRLNDVIGLGRWALIVTRSWTEDYLTAKQEQACRVYSDATLIIKGCYVGSAIGEMSYYKKNAKTSFGDAFEGSKTAAFRRCAKDFGIGTQAYSKDWCEGWKSRNPGFDRPIRKT